MSKPQEFWYIEAQQNNMSYKFGPFDTAEEGLSIANNDPGYQGLDWQSVCYREVNPEVDKAIEQMAQACRLGFLDETGVPTFREICKDAYEAWRKANE